MSDSPYFKSHACPLLHQANLHAGEVGIFVSENDDKVCLHIDHPEDGVLPPVVFQGLDEVLRGSQSCAKHSCQQGVVDEGLGGRDGDGVPVFQELAGDPRAAEQEGEQLTEDQSGH